MSFSGETFPCLQFIYIHIQLSIDVIFLNLSFCLSAYLLSGTVGILFFTPCLILHFCDMTAHYVTNMNAIILAWKQWDVMSLWNARLSRAVQSVKLQNLPMCPYLEHCHCRKLVLARTLFTAQVRTGFLYSSSDRISCCKQKALGASPSCESHQATQQVAGWTGECRHK